MASISIGIKIGAPTDSNCYAELWLSTLGYTLLFASLFVRTYRIDRIFNNENVQAVTIKDSQLFGMVAVIVSFDVAFILFSHFTNPLRATGIEIDSVAFFGYVDANSGTVQVFA